MVADNLRCLRTSASCRRLPPPADSEPRFPGELKRVFHVRHCVELEPDDDEPTGTILIGEFLVSRHVFPAPDIRRLQAKPYAATNVLPGIYSFFTSRMSSFTGE